MISEKNISKRILLLKSIYLAVHLTSNCIVEETTPKAATTPDTGSHILFMCKDIKDYLDFVC